jgi:hypothetical protein
MSRNSTERCQASSQYSWTAQKSGKVHIISVSRDIAAYELEEPHMNQVNF